MILDVPQLHQLCKDAVGYHVRQQKGRQRWSCGGGEAKYKCALKEENKIRKMDVLISVVSDAELKLKSVIRLRTE